MKVKLKALPRLELSIKCSAPAVAPAVENVFLAEKVSSNSPRNSKVQSVQSRLQLSMKKCGDSSSQYSREEHHALLVSIVMNRLFLSWLEEENREFLVSSKGLN